MPTEEIRFPSDLTHFRFVTKEPGVSPTDVYLDCHSRFSDGTPGDKYLGTIQQREGDRWTIQQREGDRWMAGIYRGSQLWLCQILYLKWRERQKEAVRNFTGVYTPTVLEQYGTSDLLLLYDKGVTRIEDNVAVSYSFARVDRPLPTDIDIKDATPSFVAHKAYEIMLLLPCVVTTGIGTETSQPTLKLGYALQFGPNEWWGHTQKTGSPIYKKGPYKTQEETIKALYDWHVESRKKAKEHMKTELAIQAVIDRNQKLADEHMKRTREAGIKEAIRLIAEEARKMHMEQEGKDLNNYVCTYAEGSAYKVGDVVKKSEKPSLAVRIDRGDFDDASLDMTSSLNPFASALVKEFDIPGDNREQTNNLRWKLFRLAHTLVPREGKEVKTYLRALAAEYRRLRQVVIEGLGREDRRMGRGKE